MTELAEAREKASLVAVTAPFTVVLYLIGFYLERTGQNVGGGMILSYSAIIGAIIAFIYSTPLILLYFMERRKRRTA